jgi:hypothetical protein
LIAPCFSGLVPHGRPSCYFYWDNLAHLRPDLLTREQAVEKATAFARAELHKLDSPEP